MKANEQDNTIFISEKEVNGTTRRRNHRQMQRNTSICDSRKLNLLQRQLSLSGLGADAMMQIEEVVAADMRRRDEQYIQNHPYAITHNKDGRWITNIYVSPGKRKTLASRSLQELHK